MHAARYGSRREKKKELQPSLDNGRITQQKHRVKEVNDKKRLSGWSGQKVQKQASEPGTEEKELLRE